MQQAECNAGSRDVARGRLYLGHAPPGLAESPGVHGGFGEITNRPVRHDWMVGLAGWIEEAFRPGIRVGMSPGTQCSRNPTELCEGRGDIRPGSRHDLFGILGGPLGAFHIAAHPGDDRLDRIDRGDPVAFAKLGRQAPAFFCCGYRHVLVGELRCYPSLQREHARQMPEASFRPKALSSRRKEARREVECTHRHGG